MELAGPLGTPLGLAQRKRASPRGEAGTSGFLSVSDCARRSYPTSKEQWLGGRRRAKRSYSTFKVRRGGGEEIALVQGKEQWLRFAGAAVTRQMKSSSFVEARRSRPAWSAVRAEFAMLNTLIETGSGRAVCPTGTGQKETGTGQKETGTGQKETVACKLEQRGREKPRGRADLLGRPFVGPRWWCTKRGK